MLTYFEVKGFKNFADKIVLDFSDVRDYHFNPGCVREGLLNKLIVYGKNAAGKSNLGLAFFDITTHLTEKNVTPGVYDSYLNVDGAARAAKFRYGFRFGDASVDYEYDKSDVHDLLYEKVTVNGKLVFSHDYRSGESDLSGLSDLVPTLNLNYREEKLSLLRYIVSNSKTQDVGPLSSLMQFVSRMLWFRSLDENRYIGYKTETADYYNFIFEGDNMQAFEGLLKKAGIHERLKVMHDPSGSDVLYFDKRVPLSFHKNASNGTKALYALFYWLRTSPELSLLFVDEFDAYYHVELAETIVEMLEGMQGFQTILTSHNTNLLSNRIMRPDCYFILTPQRLVSFANATSRELREGHNLEKLYLSGEFDA